MNEAEDQLVEPSPKVDSEMNTLVNQLKQNVRLAAEVAVAAGDFREVAFSKVLDRLFEVALSPTADDNRRDQPQSLIITPPLRRSNGGSVRKAPKPDDALLDRIRPLLDASPDLTSELASKIAQAPSKVQIYATLQFAAETCGIPRLSTAEIREVLRQVLRIGMPDGTLRGILSKAPPTEIGRVPNGEGETTYQLMHGGTELLQKTLEPRRDAPGAT